MSQEQIVWQREHMYASAQPPMNEMDNYTWSLHPSQGCPGFQQFSRMKFCNLLAGRNIIAMGDSHTGMLVRALRQLGSASKTHDPVYEYPYNASVVQTEICEDYQKSRVAFLMGNVGQSRLQRAAELPYPTLRHYARVKKGRVKLMDNNTDDRIWGVDAYLVNWTAQHRVTPDIVVANMGLHHLLNVPPAAFQKHVDKTLATILAHVPNATVIWRSTAGRHSRCASITKPLSLEQASNLTWHLYRLQRQNEVVKQLIATRYPRVIYMDVAYATQFRADLHYSRRDCTHWKLPSVAKHWVRTLYNVLLQVLHA